MSTHSSFEGFNIQAIWYHADGDIYPLPWFRAFSSHKTRRQSVNLTSANNVCRKSHYWLVIRILLIVLTSMQTKYFFRQGMQIIRKSTTVDTRPLVNCMGTTLISNTNLQSAVYSHLLTWKLWPWMLMSTPFSTRHLIVSTWPALAAKCRGVIWWGELKKQTWPPWGMLWNAEYE